MLFGRPKELDAFVVVVNRVYRYSLACVRSLILMAFATLYGCAHRTRVPTVTRRCRCCLAVAAHSIRLIVYVSQLTNESNESVCVCLRRANALGSIRSLVVLCYAKRVTCHMCLVAGINSFTLDAISRNTSMKFSYKL